MDLYDLHGDFIWAHRGRNRNAPENTMAAFRASFDAGDAGIELDIALTRDGVPVIIHDDTVDRTTSGSRAVSGMTRDELRPLDAGSWFDGAFAGEAVPDLAELLMEVRRRNRGIIVNIEIKGSAWHEDPDLSVEAPMMRDVFDAGLAGSILVSSFEWRALERMKRSFPGIPLAVLVENGADPRIAAAEARRLAAFSIHPSVEDVIGGMPGAYRDFSGRIYPYSVGSAAQGDRVLAAGADGFFADLPFPPES